MWTSTLIFDGTVFLVFFGFFLSAAGAKPVSADLGLRLSFRVDPQRKQLAVALWAAAAATMNRLCEAVTNNLACWESPVPEILIPPFETLK